VAFAARHAATLQAHTGDEGARTLLAADPTAVFAIEVDDPGVLRDIDRQEDLGGRSPR
jgi:molybdenum cofactor cytidylyltransferase